MMIYRGVMVMAGLNEIIPQCRLQVADDVRSSSSSVAIELGVEAWDS